MLTIPFERYRSLKNLLGILSGSEVEQKYLPFDKDTKLQWIAAKSIGSRLVQDTKDEAKNKKAKGAKAIADREQEPEIFDSEFPEDTSGIPEFRKRFTREKKYSKKNLVDKSMVLLDLGLPLGTEMLPDDSAAVTPPWFPQDIATVLGAEGQDDDVVLEVDDERGVDPTRDGWLADRRHAVCRRAKALFNLGHGEAAHGDARLGLRCGGGGRLISLGMRRRETQSHCHSDCSQHRLAHDLGPCWKSPDNIAPVFARGT